MSLRRSATASGAGGWGSMSWSNFQSPCITSKVMSNTPPDLLLIHRLLSMTASTSGPTLTGARPAFLLICETSLSSRHVVMSPSSLRTSAMARSIDARVFVSSDLLDVTATKLRRVPMALASTLTLARGAGGPALDASGATASAGGGVGPRPHAPSKTTRTQSDCAHRPLRPLDHILGPPARKKDH